MSTKSKNGQGTKDEIDDLFVFSSEKKEIEHEARMIMYRFLSEIERMNGNERGFKKKLAKAINKSSSFITQLFNGDKLVSLITLAKFQKKLGIKFKITAFPEEQFDLMCSPIQKMTTNVFISHQVSDISSYGKLATTFMEAELIQITPTAETIIG